MTLLTLLTVSQTVIMHSGRDSARRLFVLCILFVAGYVQRSCIPFFPSLFLLEGPIQRDANAISRKTGNTQS
jgi:hypothetical protein